MVKKDSLFVEHSEHWESVGEFVHREQIGFFKALFYVLLYGITQLTEGIADMFRALAGAIRRK